jgi:hypothetical protein
MRDKTVCHSDHGAEWSPQHHVLTTAFLGWARKFLGAPAAF